jgi:uncharacterized protein YjbI with pentapeptide repeats
MNAGARRFRPRELAALVVAWAALVSPVCGDIYEWEYIDPSDPFLGKKQSNVLTPDGAGKVLEPDVNLSSLDLTKGWFVGADLTGANFSNSLLDEADLAYVSLENASLQNASLAGADLFLAYLDAANLTGANLQGAFLYGANAIGTIFDGANLQDASFGLVLMDGGSLRNANLQGASLASTSLYEVNFEGAIITRTLFHFAEWFTPEQLYSTASYQARDLQGVGLQGLDLSDWDFTDQNLELAVFADANLSGAVFDGANITGASFSRSTGFTEGQLSSTASYQAGELHGLFFYQSDVSGWDFSGQDIQDVQFLQAVLVGTNFEGANLVNVYFDGATLTDAVFRNASLQYIDFYRATLDGADFTGATLTRVDLREANAVGTLFLNANLQRADMENGDFTGANFVNAVLRRADLTGADLTHASLIGADLQDAVLRNGNFQNADFLNADLARADARGALSMNFEPAANRQNFIQPDGVVKGWILTTGETQEITNYYGADGQPEDFFITIDESFFMEPGATLRLVFDDEVWTSTIVFGSGTEVFLLGGTLELELNRITGADLGYGTVFHVFDWSHALSVVGHFDEIVLDGDYNGYFWDTSKLYTEGTIMLVPEPASAVMAALGLVGLQFGARRRRSRSF